MSDARTLLVVGDGPVADVLLPMAGLLGWECLNAVDLAGALAALPSADAVVVTSHHAEVDAPAGEPPPRGPHAVRPPANRTRQLDGLPPHLARVG